AADREAGCDHYGVDVHSTPCPKGLVFPRSPTSLSDLVGNASRSVKILLLCPAHVAGTKGRRPCVGSIPIPRGRLLTPCGTERGGMPCAIQPHPARRPSGR